jgi:hypothetical protein
MVDEPVDERGGAGRVGGATVHGTSIGGTPEDVSSASTNARASVITGSRDPAPPGKRPRDAWWSVGRSYEPP